ncbi:hypothetical protein BX666DRAFT_1898564 [Dichotomocladium elegans]|nr:hypothetical protein BX666DRAFT_1898564 [Dichotomocladium elegans]
MESSSPVHTLHPSFLQEESSSYNDVIGIRNGNPTRTSVPLNIITNCGITSGTGQLESARTSKMISIH